MLIPVNEVSLLLSSKTQSVTATVEKILYKCDDSFFAWFAKKLQLLKEIDAEKIRVIPFPFVKLLFFWNVQLENEADIASLIYIIEESC